MPRRMLSFLAAAVILIAACSGGSAATPCPDRSSRQSWPQSATSLKDVKTVHVKVAVSGSIDTSGLLGGDNASSAPAASGSGSSLDLSGTTIEGDIDVANSAGQVTATVPALLNLTANVVYRRWYGLHQDQPDRTPVREARHVRLASGLPIPSLPAAGSPGPEASAMLSDLQAALAKLPAPTQLADETVNGQDCHHIQLAVSSADLPLASDALNGASGSATVDVWTQKSDGRPSRLVVAVNGGAQGNITFTIDLTNYDAALTIAAPPADQISDQPFTIPGLGQ